MQTKTQTLSHLRLLGLRFGLLINFHEEKLVDEVFRIVNGYNDERCFGSCEFPADG